MASGDRRLRLKLLDKDVPNRGFSEPLLLNELAVQHKVTPNYLLWYLSQGQVTNFLLQKATGAVFIRVPRQVLYDLPIPLPTRVAHVKSVEEFSIVKADNPFSKLIADMHRDYLLNFANNRFRTAAILAGAICEVILYQSLIEYGVDQSLLKDDRSLGFNKLLDYTRVLGLDKEVGFPISQLIEIQKNRNYAIHAGLLVNKGRDMKAEDLSCFDPVVKYFGL